VGATRCQLERRERRPLERHGRTDRRLATPPARKTPAPLVRRRGRDTNAPIRTRLRDQLKQFAREAERIIEQGGGSPRGASASTAPPLRACGNTEAGNGLLIGDIITRRVTCRNARRVARAVPADCGNQGTCQVRGFSCITARALEELRFARCSKPGEGEELFKVIRFDFGS